MRDEEKSREQLLAELDGLRRKLAAQEASPTPASDTLGSWSTDDPAWHSLVMQAPVFVLVLDRQHRICFANHTDSGADSRLILGRTLADFCPAGLAGDIRECVERVFLTGQPQVLEGAAFRLDDRQQWYEAHLGPILRDGDVQAVSVVAINVTQRRRVEDAVRRSEQRMRLHVDQTPLAAIEWDPQVRVSQWNPGATRIFGYTAQEAIGRDFGFLVPQEARAHVDQLWRALRDKRGGERSTNWNLTKDGRTILCEWYNTPLVDADGQVVGFASLAEDITERRRVETALRESEERFRKIFEDGPLGVAVVDLDGRIRHINRRLCEILGYTEQEIIELGLQGITHPDDWEYDRSFGSRLRRGELSTYTIEKRYVCKHGAAIWAQLTASLMRDAENRPTHIIGMVDNITDRKLAAAQLRESERRLATLISNLPGVAYRCTVDSDWTVEFLSEAYTVLTGYPVSQALGHPSSAYTDLIHPADRQAAFQQIQEALAREGKYQVEYRLRTATGAEKWIWEQGTGVFSEDGALMAVEGLVTDITSHKLAELALEQSRAELERRVEERTAELTEVNRRLVTTLESITDGFVSLDRQWRYTYVNRTAAEVLDRTREEMLGQVVWDIFPEARELSFAREFQRAVAELAPVHFEEYYPEPLNKWYECHCYPSVEGLSVYFRDVTQRKEAEEALRQGQDSLRRMLQASDRDRELITYEIHDGVAQQLAGAIMEFEAYARQRQPVPEQGLQHFDAAMKTLRDASAETRRLMNQTRTPVLRRFGVAAAIADLIDQVSAKPGAPEIIYRCETHFVRLEPALENAIFRVAQEAITNACLHSRSEVVRVTLRQDGEQVILDVQDTGIGFDPSQVAEGRFGLDSISERTRLLGKDLLIDSAPGKGTRIRATFPLIYPGPRTA
jgi:PAS domain S-box-containing protein